MTPRNGKQITSSATDTPDCDDSWHQSRWRSELRRKLRDWFSSNARELPWRSDPQPYQVWVSEIMLQQTQVATVLPFYQRWMKSFPTIADLAAADESELMRHWEGLGYYRRVRSMHAAAKLIMSDHHGEFPSTYEDVLALPGVGRYTAGAVLSISSGARLPVLEGNTQRVYSRWIALRDSPTGKAANALLWEFAAKMLPRQGSGEFNQAAMELGALVCVPKHPRCDQCPVRAQCRAHQSNLQTEIPGKIKRIQYEERKEFAFVISRHHPQTKQRGEREYLARPLPEGGRWAGLWDFPRCTEADVESVETAAEWLSRQLGADVAAGVRLKTIRHAVTKYRISLQVHQAAFAGSGDAVKAPPATWQWVTLDRMDALPMSTTGRKIVEFLATDTQTFLPTI